MKKAIWTGGFPGEKPMRERFELAVETGFDGVELVLDDALVAAEATLVELGSWPDGRCRSTA